MARWPPQQIPLLNFLGPHGLVCVLRFDFLCYPMLQTYKINARDMNIPLCYQVFFVVTDVELEGFYCRVSHYAGISLIPEPTLS